MYVTTLAEYQGKGEQTVPLMVISIHAELVATKDLALIRCDLSEGLVTKGVS